jgi:type IV secretory pathway VirJ component
MELMRFARSWTVALVLLVPGLPGINGTTARLAVTSAETLSTGAVSARLAAPDSGSLSDLRLIEAPAAPGPILAVLLSGDGGWAPADKSLAAAFTRRGISMVGFNSRTYLARTRTPDEAARDLERILRHYLGAWNRDRVIIVGYSRGANLAPFMVSRLDAELRKRVALIALLGPWEWAGFRFHFMDVLRNVHRPGDLPVRPEVAKLRGTPVLCVYGSGDRDAICPSLEQDGTARAILRDGGHRVGGKEGPALADTILSALPKPE